MDKDASGKPLTYDDRKTKSGDRILVGLGRGVVLDQP